MEKTYYITTAYTIFNEEASTEIASKSFTSIFDATEEAAKIATKYKIDLVILESIILIENKQTVTRIT